MVPYNVFTTIVLLSLFQVSQIFAEEMPAPPGFYKMQNGDIIVDDPTIAVAPKGYRINAGGMLVKDLKQAPKLKSVEKEPDPVGDPAKNQSASTEEPTEAPTGDSKDLTEIPPGFHRMPNGDIMANSPSRSKAPEGYYIDDGGILRKNGEKAPSDKLPELAAKPKAATIDDFGGVIPPGYHKMPDGTIMANSPSRAKAPEGYHLMPDGTLMPNSVAATMDHSAHSGHGGGGMLMAEYVYERMYMDGYMDSTDDVSPRELVDDGGIYGYDMTGTDMTMDMHMFMLMYHTRTYMVMLMLHYMENEMGMLTDDDLRSTMKSKGIADTILTYQRTWKYNMGWTVGLSIPTGSIDEHGLMTHGLDVMTMTPIITDTKYPYGMQLGSGTYDLIFGLDYQDTNGKITWGADWQYTLRTGENDNDYTLGDKSIVDGWVRYMHTSEITSKGKLEWMEVGQIDGADPELVPTMSPNADARNYGGRRLDLIGSVKWENSQMTSFAGELTIPVYQNLFGPQMKTEWIVGLRFGYMF